MALLTKEADDAIEWMRLRLPDNAFAIFALELEDALGDVLCRFGFNEELTDAFNVQQLVADRDPIVVADPFVSVRVTVYAGVHKYAVAGKGDRVYQFNSSKGWLRTDLTLEQVKILTATYTPETIKIRSSQL